LAAALVLTQFLVGGAQLAYSFPGYAMIGLTALGSLISLRREPPVHRLSSGCIATALLLAGYVLVRACFSPNAYLARSDAYLAAACLAVYLMTALYLTQSRYRFWIVGALLAVAVVHAAVGAFHFKTGQNGYLSYTGFYVEPKLNYRASGLLICSNHMAGYLEAMALFALSITFWSRCRMVAKLLAAYLVLTCYAGVIMSMSRGGYLSSTFSLLVFAGLSLWVVRIVNRQRLRVVSLGTAAVLVAVFSILSLLLVQSGLIRGRLNDLAHSTEDVRRFNWLATLDQFKLSPLVGTGSGTHLYYGRLFRRPQIQADPEHAHSDYLEMLAEYGIIGSALALAFLGIHLGAGLRTAREVARGRLCHSPETVCSDTLALTLACLGAVAAIGAHSVVDFNLHIPGNALLFAFVFGILASPGNDWGEKPALLQTSLRGVLAVLGLGLLVSVALKYPNERWANQSRLALRAHRYDEVSELAQKAIQADPGNPRPYFYRGEAARLIAQRMPNFSLSEPHYEEAIAAYRKGLEYFPQDENLWVRLGQSLDGLTRFEEADEAYRQAVAQDPNLGILYSYYAAHQRLIGEEESAKKCEAAAQALGGGAFLEPNIGERRTLSLSDLENEPEVPKQ
jgi:O-antigen ligase